MSFTLYNLATTTKLGLPESEGLMTKLDNFVENEDIEETQSKIYLIEIEEELKIIITNSSMVDKLHSLVYQNYNILWSLNINEITKTYITKIFKDNDIHGFSNLLESVGVDELRTTFENINNNFLFLKDFENLFKNKNIEVLVEVLVQKYKEEEEKQKENENEKKEDKEVIPFAFNEQEYTFETTSKFALLKEEKTKYYIYYNNYFNNALMITEELDKTVFPELEIVTFIENNNSDNIVQLKEILQKNYFFNIEQIKGYIKSYKLDQQITENKVEEFIKSNFTLNNNIEYKIKFTDIYKQLIKLMNVDNNESKKILKHILPKILKKLKLNKKRYSDGNYWFGIILKEKEKIPEKNIELLLEEKIYERNDI